MLFCLLPLGWRIEKTLSRRRSSLLVVWLTGGFIPAGVCAITLFPLSLLLAVLVGSDVESRVPPNSDSASPSDSNGVTSVSIYCEKFAQAYLANNGITDREKAPKATRVHVARQSDAWMWLSNLFQPPGSRFVSGYRCRFSAVNESGEAQDVSVDLLLAETLSFAQYTQWPGLQIVPIEYVVDKANDRSGYGVFKYLEAP